MRASCPVGRRATPNTYNSSTGTGRTAAATTCSRSVSSVWSARTRPPSPPTSSCSSTGCPGSSSSARPRSPPAAGTGAGPPSTTRSGRSAVTRAWNRRPRRRVHPLRAGAGRYRPYVRGTGDGHLDARVLHPLAYDRAHARRRVRHRHGGPRRRSPAARPSPHPSTGLHHRARAGQPHAQGDRQVPAVQGGA